MFGNLGAELALLDPSDNVAEYGSWQRTCRMHGSRFARDGDPSTEALGNMAAVRADRPQDHDVRPRPRVVSDPFSIERTVWEDIPFDGVTPRCWNRSADGCGYGVTIPRGAGGYRSGCGQRDHCGAMALIAAWGRWSCGSVRRRRRRREGRRCRR